MGWFGLGVSGMDWKVDGELQWGGAVLVVREVWFWWW